MQHLSFLRAARVVIALGWADFILKYRGSVLGYLWSFIVPLVKFVVIFHIFRPFTGDIPYYPLYLFLGILLWEHFALVTTACINMPTDKAMIIKKVPFSRLLLMFSVGWTHLMILLTYICIFLIFSVVFQRGLHPQSLIYLPLLLVQASLLGMGVGMLLSSYSLRYRDIPHLWTVILQMLFWLTPVMYAYNPGAPLLADIRSMFQTGIPWSLWSVFDAFIRFQPLSILIHDARRVMLYPDTLGVPSFVHLGSFTIVCMLIFIAGALLFRARSPRFIEEY